MAGRRKVVLVVFGLCGPKPLGEGVASRSVVIVTVAILAQGTILGANATRRPFLSAVRIQALAVLLP